MDTRMATAAACVAVLCGGVPARAAADTAASGASVGGPATVVTAGFIGSPGSEWLSAGGFLADGTVLLCGVSVDPELVLGGVEAKVLGKDAPALPVQKMWRRLSTVDTGKVALPGVPGGGLEDMQKDALGDAEDLLMTDAERARREKKRQEELRAMAAVPPNFRWSQNETVESANVFRKLTWLDLECTGFLAVYTPDLKTVRVLRRLPRGAGSITAAAVAADGSVYIAGAATERIAGASADVRALADVTPVERSLPGFMCPWIYIARLSPDLSAVAWVRTATGEGFGPRLRVLRGGEVALSSPDVRVFSPAGDLVRSQKVSRSRYPETVSFNPVNGRYAKGGDFLTVTGREPYRTPYFFVYNPDGSLEVELFRWRGAFAGLDSLRLVADAQVLLTVHDDDGNLTVFSKSHGGNSVNLRYPYDVDRFMPNGLRGLPQNSPGYIVKMDTNFNVIASGVWNDPGFFTSAGHGVDGSLAWTGLASHAPRVNALSGLADGLFAVVATPGLDALRFASAMPCCGKRVVVGGGNRHEEFNTATGRLEGRPMLMFLTGAVAEDTVAGGRHAAPRHNPVQPAFGGGLLDGHVVLLDLSPTPAPAREPEPEAPPPMPTAKKSVVESEPPLTAREGQRFRLGGETYFNVELTLREEPETGLWPRFFHGRAEPGGAFTYTTNAAQPAAFTLGSLRVEQADGNQDRRLFGTNITSRLGEEIETDPKGRPSRRYILVPEIRFEVTAMAPWRLREERQEQATTIRVWRRPECTVDGVLHLGDRTVDVKGARCEGRFTVPRHVEVTPDTDPNIVFMTITFVVPGDAFGFGPPWGAKRVSVRFTCTGYANVKYAADADIPLPSVNSTATEAVDELGLEP